MARKLLRKPPTKRRTAKKRLRTRKRLKVAHPRKPRRTPHLKPTRRKLLRLARDKPLIPPTLHLRNLPRWRPPLTRPQSTPLPAPQQNPPGSKAIPRITKARNIPSPSKQARPARSKGHPKAPGSPHGRDDAARQSSATDES